VPELGMKVFSAINELETGNRVLVNKLGPGVIETVDNSKDKVSIRIDGKTKVFKISIVLQKELIQIEEK
jgi:hypothetical protein